MAAVGSAPPASAEHSDHVPRERSEAYAALLRRCGSEKNLTDGKRVHDHLRRRGFDRDTFLGNLLVHMYGRCGSIGDACLAFDAIRRRDLFSWNIMIAAFAENGHLDRALSAFAAMPIRDVVSWNAIIAAHSHLGSLSDASRIFSSMPRKNAASWNVMIVAYAQHGHPRVAVSLFWAMSLEGTRPNEISFVTVLELCSIAEGRIIHAIVASAGLLSTSAKVANALITMYGECGSVEDAELVFAGLINRDVVSWTAMLGAYAHNDQIQVARELFDRMPARNVVSWNAMLEGYAQSGHSAEAMALLNLMEDERRIAPNRATFVTVLGAELDLEQGRKIQAKIRERGLESDEIVATALVAMFGICGSADEARAAFDRIERLDPISWNAIITAYVRSDRASDAIETLHRMDAEGVESSDVTLLAAIDACACLAAQAEGRSLHRRAADAGLALAEPRIANSLINMYGKSGNIAAAEAIFDAMDHRRDTFSSNVLLTIYGHNGMGDPAIDRFQQSCLDGLLPDSITFLALLQACSHSGLLDRGVEHLASIRQDWTLDPTPAHYLCVVDLLGRAGELFKAEDLVNSMPYEPEEGAWRSLLGGCRVSADLSRGERATRGLLVLDSEDSSPYVLMANIYAATRNFDRAEELRSVMAHRNVTKQPGLSWIEIKGRIHTFAANDKIHPRKEEIYAGLDGLFEELKEAGYEPDTRVALYDVDEEKKVRMLLHHSEKLAIMFGLMTTPSGSSLFVFKNLRVCSDCHAATKIVSKITGRKIVMRDASRFHHFEDGKCSCRDYW